MIPALTFSTELRNYALDNISDETVGALEVHLENGKAGIRMPFAYDLVAVALMRKKDAGQPEREFFEQSFTFLAEAFRHSIDAIQIVIAADVLQRFRG
jgi:hypothetical protein